MRVADPVVRRTPLAQVVQGYLDHLAIERGLAANTLTSYRRDLMRYLNFSEEHGVTGLDEVTPAHITMFAAWLREGDAEHVPLAASSAARTVVALRGFHRFAAGEGLSPIDPAVEVKPPVPPRRLPKALSVEQVLALLEAAGEGRTARELRDQALLEFLYGTGARISEAVGLDVDDLDLEAGSVRLRGKGSKERIVPLGRHAQQALSGYLVRGRLELLRAGEGRAAVFINARGGRLSRQSAWVVMKGAAQRANLGVVVSPHTLRHSYATHLLDGGADVRVVQELLGHASVTTTQVYTLVTVERLREVYATAHPRALG
jgi:integrase/recombinase XerD